MSRTVRGCQDSPRLQLSATGPAEVTAGMIAVSGDIEVMNPDHIICHLDQSATLTMELTADVRTYFFPWARLNTYKRRRYGV